MPRPSPPRVSDVAPHAAEPTAAPPVQTATKQQFPTLNTFPRLSAMVTRSRARGGQSMSVEPGVEYRPEGEFTQEVEIPAKTCEGGEPLA